MTDEQVVKALECCTKKYGCCDCPLENDELCMITINKEALDLIKRQQAEIERLNKRVAGQKHALFEQQAYTAEMQNELATAKSEAYKEFADLFKQEMRNCANAEFDGIKYYLIGEEFVNRRLKELTEVSNGK